ncbi:hypothetical protein LSH36_404g00013 [Paralvinella palmiformis]|uniref:Innexin n=1 Tax=Paralvinella palmiformis TaxID=53620 RepID=A0AAD9JDL4_9ANNE|nr:hypothetical protein LSH36_404g00013 [Paralvinella palmiformis]
MERIISLVTADPSDWRLYGGDSVTDQLSSVHTFYLLMGFAFIVQAGHLIGSPIECWCPAHFTSTHSAYTDKVCWTTNTYYLPYDEEIPKEDGPHKHIGYYQWVALILSCQAILFYLPRPIWRLFNKKSGIAVSTITDAAIECQRKADFDSRDKTLRYMVKHMGRFLVELSSEHELASRLKSCWYAVYGNYLVITYLVIKLVYITNVIGQLFMLNAFLDTNFNMYGIEILQKMAMGEEWTSSERFPRVTLCDFKIRVLGNVHRYTVQCSLPMNLFNEIIFIFIWFWFAFVTTATVGSLLMWLYTSLYLPHNRKYIKSRLMAMDKVEDFTKHKVDLNYFVDRYLRRDGCFIIRMVAKNASDIIAAELICGLWDHYLDNKKKLFKREKALGDQDVLDELNA